jgi:hypothetical protein
MDHGLDKTFRGLFHDLNGRGIYKIPRPWRNA